MKALILVGGYGTRLRPLTLSVPKPLIHFCNRPIIEYQIRALVQLGVRHIILAVAYRPDAMREALDRLERKYSVRLTCSVEEEPLQTAGPIRLASELLHEDEKEEIHADLFFVFNSDIICEFPLADMLKFHLHHHQQGTICVTKVPNPSAYGVVVHDPNSGQVENFVEKPEGPIFGNYINAGLYLFHRSIIDRIEPRPVSIEREIFPQMALDKQLFCYRMNGYWADIGQPHDFLEGTKLYLSALANRLRTEHHNTHEPCVELAKGHNIVGNVLIHPTSTIGENCLLGPNVTIGPNCTLGDGVRISNSALMANVTVGDHSWMDCTIIGWNSKIGKWVRIEGITVLGQDVNVKAECYLNGAFILPYKGISQSIPTAGTIVM